MAPFGHFKTHIQGKNTRTYRRESYRVKKRKKVSVHFNILLFGISTVAIVKSEFSEGKEKARKFQRISDFRENILGKLIDKMYIYTLLLLNELYIQLIK